MDIVYIILFVCIVLLLLAQSITLMEYRRKYIRACDSNSNVNRALSISKDEVLRLKKELGWSGKQLEMALKGESPNPTLEWLKEKNPDVNVDAVMMNKWNAAKVRTHDSEVPLPSVSFVKLDTDGNVVPLPTPGYSPFHNMGEKDKIILVGRGSGKSAKTLEEWSTKVNPIQQPGDSSGISDEEMLRNWDAQDNPEVPSCSHCDVCSPQPDKQTIDQWYKENGPLDPRD